MYDFFAKTAWKMEQFPAYGFTHLSLFFCGLLLTGFATYKLRNITEKKLDRILFFTGLFLIATEIYKQLFHIYYFDPVGSYKFWIFPFHLCSIPMYFCVIIPFVKNKTVKKAMYSFLASYNLLGGFMAFIEPSGIISDYVILTVHSFMWHMIIVFTGMIIGTNRNLIFRRSDYKYSVLCYIVLALTALTINVVFSEASGGDLNMFFIGPPISSIIVFHDIAEKFGWVANAIFYSAMLSLGAYIAFFPFTKMKKPETELSITSETHE